MKLAWTKRHEFIVSAHVKNTFTAITNQMINPIFAINHRRIILLSLI